MTSLQDFVAVEWDKQPQFMLIAFGTDTRHWVQVDFGRKSVLVTVSEIGDTPRAVYSRVIALLEFFQRKRRRLLERICLFVGLFTGGVWLTVITTNVASGRPGWRYVVVNCLLLIFIPASYAWNFLTLTGRGPKLPFLRPPGRWSSNRRDIGIAILGGFAAAFFLVLLAYLGIKH